MIAAYILIQTDVGTAAMVTAALRDVPGVAEAASVAGPYDIIARAQAHDIDELGKLVTSPGPGDRRGETDHQLPGRSHVTHPMAADHHTTIREAGEGGAQAVCTCGWRSPCSARTRRPARWTRCSRRPKPAICTSGRCPCNRRCPMLSVAMRTWPLTPHARGNVPGHAPRDDSRTSPRFPTAVAVPSGRVAALVTAAALPGAKSPGRACLWLPWHAVREDRPGLLVPGALRAPAAATHPTRGGRS